VKICVFTDIGWPSMLMVGKSWPKNKSLTN